MPAEVEGHDYKVRAHQRRAALHDVSIRVPGLGRAKGTLSNVSTGGVGLKTSQFLPIGATVHLSVGDGAEVPLRIRWQLGGAAGATFASDAPADAVEATLRRIERKDAA